MGTIVIFNIIEPTRVTIILGFLKWSIFNYASVRDFLGLASNKSLSRSAITLARVHFARLACGEAIPCNFCDMGVVVMKCKLDKQWHTVQGF